MRRAILAALVVALAGCRSVPEVFETPKTDAAIKEAGTAIDAISGAAKTLDATVQTLNVGDTLTIEQLETIKAASATIKTSAAEAKSAVVEVKESHEKDNQAASVIVADYQEVKNDNKQLKTVLFAMIGGLSVAFAALWFFRK